MFDSKSSFTREHINPIWEKQRKLHARNFIPAPTSPINLNQRIAELKAMGLAGFVQEKLPENEKLPEALEKELTSKLNLKFIDTPNFIQTASDELKSLRISNPQELEALTKNMIANINNHFNQKLNELYQETIDRFDKDDGFRTNAINQIKDKFDFDANLSEEQIKAKAKQLLLSRLHKEYQRRNNSLKEIEKSILKYASEWLLIQARIYYTGEAKLILNTSDVNLQTGDILKLPPDGTYNVSNKKVSLTSAFLGDKSGAPHIISENGTHHSFNPQNIDSIYTIMKMARAVGAKEVELKLGGGVHNQYQLFGTISPDTESKLRKPALIFKFEMETGIPFEQAKFLSKKLAKEKLTVAQLKERHDELLQQYQTAKADLLKLPKNQSDPQYLQAKAKFEKNEKAYKKFISQYVSIFNNIPDVALGTDEPGPIIKANISGFHLEFNEEKYYDVASEMRHVLKHIRGQNMLLASKHINASENFDNLTPAQHTTLARARSLEQLEQEASSYGQHSPTPI